MKKVNSICWSKTLKAIIKSGDLHKVWMRLLNFEPFLIPHLDWLDKILAKNVKGEVK